MADERAIVETAYPGDIIGLFDPGIYRLGDTISQQKDLHFARIPVFAPEHFARVRPFDSMKRKQFLKGIMQLSNEGAIQTFTRDEIGLEQSIVGVVGVLQFDVFEYRMNNEYNVDIRMQRMPHQFIRWIENDDLDWGQLVLNSDTKKVQDFHGGRLLLFTNNWSINWALEHNEGLQLSEFSRN